MHTRMVCGRVLPSRALTVRHLPGLGRWIMNPLDRILEVALVSREATCIMEIETFPRPSLLGCDEPMLQRRFTQSSGFVPPGHARPTAAAAICEASIEAQLHICAIRCFACP
ncbi:hypothetical protein CC85DRAFT_190112 [Cutaneotrichosporon oleaginosum]|uniref:Uncharacterized protein n=1 Tax=Cutaneotrichosporon oleaginosum TaxID=879819 RepID=A0A0J0XUW8_9TREE|nr:uncharacterized protein CC85DRAFT_190112 [Cutaneotrichosporon oleaginosum]KLT44883.1 hypothetical protein CC85DRAFT_190112 [Cutaneotrichosporon oleaginosum]TXT12014.1 hypothetical protein COLE_02424 [Cutaneotrichosporon oleaginosum]